MLSDAEAAELRELQRRAYAPDGDLDGTSVRRLEDLERRRVADVPVPLPASAAADAAPRDRAEDPDAGVPAAEEAHQEEPELSASVPARRRRRWVPAAAAVSLVVLGSIGGWLLAQAQQAPASVPVTDAQRDHILSSLPEGADTGSLLALGEHEGVLAWYVTAQDGADTCLLLDDGKEAVIECRGSDYLADTPLTAIRQVDSTGDVEYTDVTYATLVLTPDGRPAIEMDGYRSSGTGMVYANDTERETAEAIADAGYLRDTIYVIGHWDDVPVWAASRSGSELCLVYVPPGDELLSQCGDPSASEPSTVGIGLIEGFGSDAVEVLLELTMGPTVGPYLTITERRWGDTILDVPEDDGLSIDDTTGDVSG